MISADSPARFKKKRGRAGATVVKPPKIITEEGEAEEEAEEDDGEIPASQLPPELENHI